MKTVLLPCLILFFSSADCGIRSFGMLKHNPPPPKGSLKSSIYVTETYFTQNLDHFDSTNENTWLQRYFVNTEYFNATANNVVFLLLGGEGDASELWMDYGSWIVSAKKYGALLFQLEHRYYGVSQPFDDVTTEHLRYLSSEQALADAANFIKAMNEQYSLPSDVKWIAFGGSYSGSLAAWMRLKYPDLILGAMSASSPLLAKLDFPEYFQVVVDDLATYSEECVSSLTTAMKEVDDLLNNPNEEESLTSIFNLCKPVEEFDLNDPNVVTFYNSLSDVFAVVAQYSGTIGLTIDSLCDPLTDKNEERAIIRLSNTINILFGTQCIDYSYEEGVEYLKNTSLVEGGSRQWMYQTCSEYGWYQTTNREDKIFGERGTSVDFYTNLCTEIFGQSFNETYINAQISQTNAFYGGIDIDVSNVVYVHGSLDPWHAAGLLKTTNPDSPVIYIDGTSHCANMYDITGDELPQLTAAKDEVDRLIGVWLGFN